MATERLAIIATKGTLDMAYPPLILASTAASLGVETAVFFTFYGLNIIHKKRMHELKIAPIGNPAMPMAFPPSMQNAITNAISSIFPGPPQIMGIIPGMTDLMSYMMKKTIKEHGVADIPDLLEACKEADVKLIPCQMTMELFGYKYEDLIDGLEPPAGAATFMNYVLEAEKPMIIFV
ncbi:MAG: DsrE/DsrF/DrsH-like family protein [Aquificaceae bacterium]|nr:DsrE/DsrF/DrsH-like family protein [Aquificaceae bacterium]MCS7277612.1 DsrE/DsrF/DrsH-like family protein [Aquificaceae bacterium]MDW8066896.1 DsrE/DsrF/DrsH-like family protein [Aquificaceae bacterium]MDW8423729.1 DsrE/DsrF/DrsH-like family protein [Aquificaceae bacterium]